MRLLAAIFAGLAAISETSWAQPANATTATNAIRIVELQGQVELSPAGATTWVLTQTNQLLFPHDRLRTSTNSRVALRWSDQSIVPFGPSTELEILPPHTSDAQSGLRLIRGILSFFHRDQPSRIRVLTRGAVAGVEGTEFVLEVAAANGTERATLSVIDGRVRFGNDLGSLILTNDQQAVVELGQAPVRTPGFIVNHILQWCFYYPAVLDLADLPLSQEENAQLGDSLAAYRAGDLLGALAKYPAARRPGTDAERVYYAALLLSVGQVEETEQALASLSMTDATARPQRLAAALRQLIAAVKREPQAALTNPELPTELLASSYYEQSRAVRETSLTTALTFAKKAAAQSPQSGFAWARVAELELSFGRNGNALNALDQSLTLAPRHAQALAAKGFLLAAQNRTREALEWFERALAVDAALGNAWLGRGLCRIRRGDATGGREDMLIAAALEPRRAELRSYLGKADAVTGDFPRAAKELQLAQSLDPNDPTAWLYGALLKQQQNQINGAIRDLEKSQALNDNRSVYRSQLLLDQDHAVRSANLASIYQDAGMSEVALREASRAVNYDYANYSAHLFLANSYLALQDPNLVNLRYETARHSEFLLANLLAPVSAGTLSPILSQRESSRLFERDRFGVVSETEYLSRGAWSQSGSQYGTFQNFSYDFEAFYRFDPGQRINNDLEERVLALTLKHQLTPQDSIFLRVQHAAIEGGDLAQRYDPNSASPAYRYKETQAPAVTLGYHHEWSPGNHTIFLVTRLEDTASVTNPTQATLFTIRPDVDPVNLPGVTELVAVNNITMREQLEGKLEIYSGELQQIFQQPKHTTILGGRAQYGHFHTTNLQDDPSAPFSAYFPPPGEPSAQQDFTTPFKRFSIYGYHQWQIVDSLQLIGGLTYDLLSFPENFRYAPISSEEKTVDQVSPKAGLVWTPAKNTALRFAYTRALSGASLDQSQQLEPAQVAGFVQSFRSLIPESVAGPNAGARFETYGLSLEQKFDSGTFLGILGEFLRSDVSRLLGAFDGLPDQFDFAIPSGLRQDLDYQEQSLLFTANQLLNQEWSFGARYRLSRADLKQDLVDVPDFLPFGSIEPRQRFESLLHHLGVFAIYNHPCGFFAKVEAEWYRQTHTGFTPGESLEDFWQFNLFAGYRFPRRKAEAAIGLLNLTDQDYRLSPLSYVNELPRERTLALWLRFNF